MALLADPEFRPESITSGPPKGLRLTITKISLEGPSLRETIFESAEGAVLDIQGSKIDLTGIFATKSDGLALHAAMRNMMHRQRLVRTVLRQLRCG